MNTRHLKINQFFPSCSLRTLCAYRTHNAVSCDGFGAHVCLFHFRFIHSHSNKIWELTSSSAIFILFLAQLLRIATAVALSGNKKENEYLKNYVPLFRARSLYHPEVQCVPKWSSRVDTGNSFCVMRAPPFPFNLNKEKNKLRSAVVRRKLPFTIWWSHRESYTRRTTQCSLFCRRTGTKREYSPN